MPLVLDLVRHGEAVAAGAAGDGERALSAAGREALARLAARLAGEGWRPDRILSSPLRRARETAEILRASLRSPPAIELADELLAECDPGQVLEALETRGIRSGHVLLVTHQPLAGLLVAHLCGREQPFAPGTLARIECAAAPRRGRGRVVATIPPGRES